MPGRRSNRGRSGRWAPGSPATTSPFATRLPSPGRRRSKDGASAVSSAHSTWTPAAFAVLDLVGDRFQLIDADGDDATVVSDLASQYPELEVMTLARIAGEATPVILAAIEPFPPGPDDAQHRRSRDGVRHRAVPGLVGVEPERVGHGVGGSVVRGSSVGERTLTRRRRDVPVTGLLVRDEVGSMQGLIGMDVLRGTILVVSADDRRPVTWLYREAHWRPAGAPPATPRRPGAAC